MSGAEILLCILVNLEQTKSTNEDLLYKEVEKPLRKQNRYEIGLYQGYINYCKDLIRFINDNLDVDI